MLTFLQFFNEFDYFVCLAVFKLVNHMLSTDCVHVVLRADSVKPLVKQYVDELEAVKIKNGLRTTMAISKLANAYLQTKEPWKHIKKNSTGGFMLCYFIPSIF